MKTWKQIALEYHMTLLESSKELARIAAFDMVMDEDKKNLIIKMRKSLQTNVKEIKRLNEIEILGRG